MMDGSIIFIHLELCVFGRAFLISKILVEVGMPHPIIPSLDHLFNYFMS